MPAYIAKTKNLHFVHNKFTNIILISIDI